MYNAKVKVILSTPWRLRRQPCQMFSKCNTIIGDIAAYKSVYTFKGILCYMLPVLRSTGRQINVTCNSIFSIWNFVKLETDMRSKILLMHKSWSLWTICQKVKICLIHLRYYNYKIYPILSKPFRGSSISYVRKIFRKTNISYPLRITIVKG